MLKNSDGGTLEIKDEVSGSFDIENISIAQPLALKLLKVIGEVPVKSRRLMRIISIAKVMIER